MEEAQVACGEDGGAERLDRRGEVGERCTRAAVVGSSKRTRALRWNSNNNTGGILSIKRAPQQQCVKVGSNKLQLKLEKRRVSRAPLPCGVAKGAGGGFEP